MGAHTWCPQCGTALPLGAGYCPGCGRATGAPLAPAPKAKRRGRSPLAMALIVGLLLCLAVVTLPRSESGTMAGTAAITPTAIPSGRIGANMDGNDWRTLNARQKAGVAQTILDALWWCPQSSDWLVAALDDTYATAAPRAQQQTVAETANMVLTIDGCTRP